jgi:hypothetical protein
VVSIEGFVIAFVLPAEIDEELVSGIAAAMLGVGERISGQLMGSVMEQTYVRSEKGVRGTQCSWSRCRARALGVQSGQTWLALIEFRRRCAELAKII